MHARETALTQTQEPVIFTPECISEAERHAEVVLGLAWQLQELDGLWDSPSLQSTPQPCPGHEERGGGVLRAPSDYNTRFGELSLALSLGKSERKTKVLGQRFPSRLRLDIF